MSVTIASLAAYLGEKSSALLSDAPFSDWKFQRSIQKGAGRRLIDYTCPRNGIDFVCNSSDRVESIFLHNDGRRVFNEDVADVPLSSMRQDVLSCFGDPSESGEGHRDPVLGEFGGWDRFWLSDYAVHVEYKAGSDHIKKITLMRTDVVP